MKPTTQVSCLLLNLAILNPLYMLNNGYLVCEIISA